MSEIYKITNLLNGHFYIGKTVSTAEQRFYGHTKEVEYGSTTKFHNALRKYGKDNFSVETLQFTSRDVRYLNLREKFWIRRLKPWYNTAPGGDGGWINDQTGKRWKVKDSSKMGRVFKERRHADYIDPMKWTSGNNYQSTHFIVTPWGTFETWRDATRAAQQERFRGNRLVVTDVLSLQSYCAGKVLSAVAGPTRSEWRGKHTHDLGFNLIAKGNDSANC